MSLFKFLLPAALFIFLTHPDLNAQRHLNFDSIRAEITSAKNDWNRVHNIILAGSMFSPSQADSIYSYVQKLSNEADTNQFALAGKYYLEGLALAKKSRLRECVAPLKKAIKSFRELGNFHFYFAASNYLGTTYNRSREYEKSLSLYNELLEEGEKLNAHQRKVINGNLGITYRRLGHFDKAIYHFEQTITIDPDDKFSVTNGLMQISSIYLMLDYPEKALATLNKTSTAELENHPVAVAYYNNKGEIFNQLKNYDSAIFYYEKGIAEGERLRHFHQTVKPAASLARIHILRNNPEKAEKALSTAENKCPKYCPPPVNLDYLLAAGELKLAINQPAEAITYVQRAVDLSQKTKTYMHLNNAFELMATAHELLGDEVKALEYQKKNVALKDSIDKSSHSRFIADARTRYETAEKERALAASQADKSLFQKLATQIGLLATLLLGGSIFFYMKYDKSNGLLILKEEEITRLNEMLREKQQHNYQVDIFPKYLVLKSKAKIDLDQLQYVYVDGHYLEFFLTEKDYPEIDRNTLSSLQEELPEIQFVRIHRSYVVNVNFIKAIYSKKVVLESGNEIPVSRTYKSNLENILLQPASVV